MLENKQFGDMVLYVPVEYETKLDDDFKSESDKTIRQRIMELSGIVDVRVSDFLAAGNVLMVHMNSSTVRMVEGMPISNVQWESSGGFALNFKVMTIMVPQIRNDMAGQCGIVHYTEV